MIKENKKLIIVTSVVTLLPMVVGLLLWNIRWMAYYGRGVYEEHQMVERFENPSFLW